MNLNLHSITNSFLDVRLASLASWRQANEFYPRDRGGPYVVLQEGYDPEDLTMNPDEFVLGRSGKWLPIAHFYQMPVPDRRDEFVFGTAAEVMQMLDNLPAKAEIVRPSAAPQGRGPSSSEPDEMAMALKTGKSKSPGGAS
jgi:hypothetical protein